MGAGFKIKNAPSHGKAKLLLVDSDNKSIRTLIKHFNNNKPECLIDSFIAGTSSFSNKSDINDYHAIIIHADNLNGSTAEVHKIFFDPAIKSPLILIHGNNKPHKSSDCNSCYSVVKDENFPATLFSTVDHAIAYNSLLKQNELLKNRIDHLETNTPAPEEMKEMIESVQKFKTLYETLPCAIFIYQNTGFVFVNAATTTLTGFSEDELMKMNFWDIVHPEHREIIKQRGIKRQQGDDPPSRYEFKVLRKDGTTRWVDFTANKIEFNGKLAVTGTALDITDRKTAERKFETIFEHSIDGILLLDLEKNVFHLCNRTMCDMLGYSQEEITKLSIDDIHPSNQTQNIKTFLEKQAYGNESRAASIPVLRKDGSVFYADINSYPLELEGKKYLVGLFRDITEKRTTEMELIKLSYAVDQSPATVLISDLNGNIEYVNTQLCKVSGYSRDELIGKNPKIFKSNKTDSKTYSELWGSITTGKQWKGEMLNKRKDGTPYWIRFLISPICDKHGKPMHYLAIGEDITESKKINEELVLAKENAESANHAKTVFLANMSHELRTPLIGILGYSELLMNELKSDEQLEMVKGIHRSGNRLLKTLSFVLDLAKVEADKLEIDIVPIDVVSALNEIYRTFRGAAEVKNISFKLETHSASEVLETDPNMFRVIFDNLVNNAFKFTPNGSVTIKTEKITENENDYIIIKVIDTGIGISEEYHKLIFQEFRQVSEGIHRQFQGTGLGLSITKKYIELLNGSITVGSAIGAGTTFTVKFPLPLR